MTSSESAGVQEDRGLVLVTAHDISHSFPEANDAKIQLFGGLSFKIRAGDCFLVTGPNGSGKSTLLNILAGIATPSKGSLYRMPGLDHAYLAQEVSKYAGRDLTLCEQVNLGRLDTKNTEVGSRNLSGHGARYYASQLLSPLGLGLEDRLDVYMRHLSGGQVQAAMLVALLGRHPPRLILLDEHASALDNRVRAATERWLASCVHDHRSALVIVSHLTVSFANLTPITIELPAASLLRS